MHLEGARKEIARMLDMAKMNVDRSFHAFIHADTAAIADVEERESYIDYLNKEISRAISKMMIP